MRIAALAFLAVALSTSASAQDRTVQHATGTFEVTMTPDAQAQAIEGMIPTARQGLIKIFSGGLVGEAHGTMLSAGSPEPGKAAAYVALDQVHGRLAGHVGNFILLHRGTMTKAGQTVLQIEVAPDSGTDGLTGITGSLTIEVKGGKHFYDFAYTLPAPR